MLFEKNIKSVNPEFLDNKVIFVDGLIGGEKLSSHKYYLQLRMLKCGHLNLNMSIFAPYTN